MVHTEDDRVDQTLRAALTAFATQAIPAGTSVKSRVMTRLRKDSAGEARRVTRPFVVLVAAALLILIGGAGAYATGTLTAPIRFVFHPFSRTPSSNSSFSLSCPPYRQTTAAEASRLVRFRLYTLNSYGPARLTAVTVMPPCSNQPNFSPTVQLNYVIDNTTVELIEGPAEHPGQPLTLSLKGSGPGIYPWKLVTIAGSTYAVSQLPLQDKFGSTGGLSGGMWQQGNTFFSLNTNASIPCPKEPSCYYDPGMTMETFTDLVQHLTSSR